MEIVTKFGIGDQLFYLDENACPQTGTIGGIEVVVDPLGDIAVRYRLADGGAIDEQKTMDEDAAYVFFLDGIQQAIDEAEQKRAALFPSREPVSVAAIAAKGVSP